MAYRGNTGGFVPQQKYASTVYSNNARPSNLRGNTPHAWASGKSTSRMKPHPPSRRTRPKRLSDMSSLSLRTREELHAASLKPRRSYGSNAPLQGYSMGPAATAPGPSNRMFMNSQPLPAPPSDRPIPLDYPQNSPRGGRLNYDNHSSTGGYDRKAPMNRSLEAQEAARARAALIDRERRQIFGYLASPNCYLFSEVQGAVSLTEEDLDLLLAAGGTSTATLGHLRQLDSQQKKFSGFGDLIPAVQAAHLTSLENKKDILAYLSGPRCSVFGKSPTIFVTVADVDRLVDEGGAGPDTLRYIKAFDKAGERFDVFNDLILSVRDAHLETLQARRRKAPKDNKTEEERERQRLKDQDRKTILAHLANPNCKLFSEAREVKAVASELDKLIEEGRTVPETILLLQDLDDEGRKFQSFAQVIPAVREARAKRAERLLEADDRRQKLFGYLSSPTCTLFADARGEVKATASDLDQVLEEGGNSVPETIHLLKNLDAAGRKFNSVHELIPSVKDGYLHDEKKKQMDEAERVRQSVLEFLSSPESEFFTEVDDVNVTTEELDRLVGQGGPNTLFHLKHLNGQGRKFETFQQLIYAVKAACIHAVEKKRELYDWMSAPSREIFEPESDVTVTPDDIDRLYISGYAGPDTLAYLRSFEDNGEKFKTHHHLVAAVKNAHLWAIERRKQNQLDKIASDKNRKRIIAYLSRDDCRLFSEDVEDIHVKKADLDTLIKEGGSVSDTLFFLDELNRSGVKYEEFPDLIPAIRDCARTASIAKKKMLEKLSDPDCILWVDPDEVLVSEADIDRLFLEGTAGADTLDSLLDFERDRTKFQFFDDLVIAVRKMYSSKRQAMEIDSKAALEVEQQQMRRDTVLAYLSSSQSTMFSEAEDVHVTDEDLDALTIEGGTVGTTLLFLKHLDAEGHRFMSFDQLLLAVRDCKIRAENDKVALLNYLTNPQCRLLSDSGVELKLTLEDMDRLYEEGTAGPQTIFHLMDMTDNSQRFKSFSALIEALVQNHAVWLQTRKCLKDMIHAHLVGPMCNLFYDVPDVGEAQLNRLMSAGRTGPATLFHIENLDGAGRKFENIDQLVPAVQDAHTDLEARKIEVLDYFQSPRCKLLDLRYDVTPTDVHRLFIEGTAGPETMCHLWAFSAASRKFGQFDRLIDSVKAAHIDSLEKEKAERLAVITHLAGPKCTLFDAPVNSSLYDLDRLVSAGGGRGDRTLAHIEDLDAAGHKFVKFDDLVAMVKTMYKEETEMKQKMLWRFKSPQCGFFTEAAPGLADALTMDDMDALFSVGRDGRRIKYYIDVFEENKSKFISFDEVLASVKEAHRRTMSAFRDEKAMIYAHLASDGSTVLSDEVEPSDRDLDRLFKVGGSGPAILFHLERLEEAGKQYNSMPALTQAIRGSHLSAVERKEELLAHFKHPRCKLFTGVPGGVDITREGIDRLYVQGQAGPETLIHLWSFDAAGRKFGTFDELIVAVNDAHIHSLERSKEERLMLIAHLSRPNCTLFTGPIHASSDDVDRLIQAATSAPAALHHLERLESEASQFDTFDDLVSAVKYAQDTTIEHKRDLLRYLTRPDCGLFRNAQYDIKITPQNIDRLYEKGRAGPMTIEHVRALDVRSDRYGSLHHFDELIDAVKSTHMQALKKRRAERKAQQEAEARQLKKAMEEKERMERELALQVSRATQAANLAKSNEEAARAAQLREQEAARASQLRERKEDARRRREAQAAASSANASSRSGVEEAGPINVSGGHYADSDEKYSYLARTEQLTSQEEKDRQAVFTYLLSPRREFFINAPVPVVPTEQDVDRLATEGRTYASTLLHLEYLDGDGAKFQSMDELVAAVGQRHLVVVEKKNDVLTFLRSSDLFQDEQVRDNLTSADANRLYEESRARVYLLPHLETLNASSLKIADMDELIYKVKQKHLESRERIKTEKHMIMTHILAPKCQLFAHHQVDMSDSNLDELLAAGRSGSSTLTHLEQLDSRRARFASVQDLIKAVEADHNQSDDEKKRIRSFINSEEGSSLFRGVSGFQASAEDADKLYQLGTAGATTYTYVCSLQKQDKSYNNIEELAAAVKAEHLSAQDQIKAEKIMILAYLFGPQSNLFVSVFQLTGDDMDSLYEAGENGNSCLFYLRELEAQKRQFENVDELIAAVTAMREQASARKVALLQFLESQDGQELFDTKETVPFDVAQTTKLYEEGGAGANTLPLLQSWSGDEKRRYADFDGLLSAVQRETLRSVDPEEAARADAEDAKAEDQNGFEDSAEDKLAELDTNLVPEVDPWSPQDIEKEQLDNALLQYLSAPSSNLFNSATQRDHVLKGESKEELQAVLHAAVDPARTYQHLENLDEEGFRPQDLGQLEDAIADADEAGEHETAEIMKYLNSDDCKLLAEEVDSKQVQTLFVGNVPRSYSLANLKTMEGKTYDSIQQLGQELKVRDANYRKAIRAQKSIVLSHLRWPFTTVLTSHARDVSEGDVARLIIQGGAGAGTLYALKSLQVDGVQCNSVDELINSIRQSRLDTATHKNRLFTLLSQDTAVFSNSGTVATQEDADRIVDASNPSTVLTHIWAINAAGDRYSSMDQLQEAIKTRESANQVPINSTNFVLKTHFAGPPASKLLPANASVKESDLSAMTSLVDSPNGAGDVLNHLALMETDAQKFDDVDQLRNALAAAIEREVSDQDEIEAFLTSPEGKALLIKQSEITSSSIHALYFEGGAGPNTLRHLKVMAAKNESYSSMADLCTGVSQTHIPFQNQLIAQREEKIAEKLVRQESSGDASSSSSASSNNDGMSGAKVLRTNKQPVSEGERHELVSFLADLLARSDLFDNDDAIHVTGGDLNRLGVASKGAENAKRLLNKFSAEKRIFSTFEELIDAVRAQQRQDFVLKEKLISSVQDPSSPLQSLTDFRLTPEDIEAVSEQSGAYDRTKELMNLFASQGRSFTSLGDLTRAVKKLHNQFMVVQAISADILLSYLSNPLSHLLYGRLDDVDEDGVPLMVSSEDAKSLLALCPSVSCPALIDHLSELDVREAHFDNVQALAKALNERAADENSRKADLSAVLNQHVSHLFEPEVSDKQVDLLWSQGQRSDASKTVLLSLIKSGHQFASFDALVEAMQLSYANSLGNRLAHAEPLLAFLNGPLSNLFSSSNIVYNIDKLVDVCQVAGAGTVLVAWIVFDKKGTKFHDFEELLEATEAECHKADQVKQTLLDYFDSPSTGLFVQAEYEVEFDDEMVDILYRSGGYGNDSQAECIKLDEAGERFDSGPELIKFMAANSENQRIGQSRPSSATDNTIADTSSSSDNKTDESASSSSLSSEPSANVGRDDQGAKEWSPKDRIIKLLQSSGTVLCDFDAPISDEHIEELIKVGGGSESSLSHLETLNSMYYRYQSVSELISAVSVSQQSGSHVSAADHAMLVSFLSSEDRTLFADSKEAPVVNSQLAPEFAGSNLDKLALAGHGIHHLIRILIVFESYGIRLVNNQALFTELANIKRPTVSTEILSKFRQAASVQSSEDIPDLSDEEVQQITNWFSDPANTILPADRQRQVSKQILSQMKREAKSVEEVLRHLDRINKMGCQFTTFTEVFKALRAAIYTGCHISEESATTILNYLNKVSLLFYSVKEAQVPTEAGVASCLEQIVSISKGERACLFHLHQFDQAGRSFQTLDELIEAFKLAVAQETHVSVDVHTKLFNWLKRPECTMFNITQEVTVAGADLDDILITGQGIDNTLKHFSRFEGVHRSFDSLSQIAPALREALSIVSYVAPKYRDELLGNVLPEMKLFKAGSTILLAGPDIDALFQMGLVIENIALILAGLRDEGKQYTSFEDLRDDFENHLLLPDIDHEKRVAVVEAIQENAVLELSSALSLDESHMDAIVRVAGGFEKAITKLKHFGAKQMKFASFYHLIPEMAENFQEGVDNSEPADSADGAAAAGNEGLTKDQSTLLEWLANSGMFAAGVSVDVSTEELDRILAHRNGVEGAFVHLTKLKEKGMQFTSFGELLPAIEALEKEEDI